ncbi:MAG TPA: molybdenum ABC transporter ATP-binding protein [Candidatus Binatia bacterium]
MLLRCRVPLAEFELDLDVSFDVQITSIFGPSGAGKTTLLDIIAGLRPVEVGEIEINGKTLLSTSRGISLSPQERNIGYVPQEGALFPHLSVRKNILFGSRRRNHHEPSHAFELGHVADILEIGTLLDRAVTKLSGGEAQRVALARAILSRPQLLLLDEPLAALDVGLKDKILPYLGRVRDEFSIPIIYVSHNVAEVIALADWVLMIHRGKLVDQGIPGYVLRSRNALETMTEESVENVFNVSVVDTDKQGGRTRALTKKRLELFIPYIESPGRQPLQVRLSGDDIVLATEHPRGISAANVIAGRIAEIAENKEQCVLAVDAGEIFYVRLTPSAVSRLRLVTGLPVFLIIKTRSFRLL